MKITMEVLEGGYIPRRYGVAYYDWPKRVAVCYLIPLNLLAAFAKSVWFSLKAPQWHWNDDPVPRELKKKFDLAVNREVNNRLQKIYTLRQF